MMEAAAQCVALVLIEMGLSFSGIVFNLLIVATLRQEVSARGNKRKGSILQRSRSYSPSNLEGPNYYNLKIWL